MLSKIKKWIFKYPVVEVRKTTLCENLTDTESLNFYVLKYRKNYGKNPNYAEAYNSESGAFYTYYSEDFYDYIKDCINNRYPLIVTSRNSEGDAVEVSFSCNTKVPIFIEDGKVTRQHLTPIQLRRYVQEQRVPIC